ncbi:MAG: hypothetical protein M0Z30_22465 [Actinomycetota bacterium]|nr:hypothetical protein [Actinomycetota bacterium]
MSYQVPRSEDRPDPRFEGRAGVRGDDGFVGGFEGLLFGMLIFVVGVLLVAYAWAVVDTKTATGEAARQAARTYVEAADAAAAARQAQQAADTALTGYGRDPARARVRLVSGQFARCARITISVTYPAPLFQLPFIGPLGSGVSVRSEHSELVDPFRTGLAGTAACP